MKIVILDGYTLNPGDLSYERFSEFGEFQVYEYTLPGQVIERAMEADVVFTNKTRLTKAMIEALPKLDFIGVLATGFDVVDVKAAAARKIPVANIPAYGTDSVAQMVFAHLLNWSNRVELHAQGVRTGRWHQNRDFCYWQTPLTELAGKTFGIVGLGRIGQKVSGIARAFGMNVIAYSRSCRENLGIEMVTLDELLRRSDVVSLHCPLTTESRYLINMENLRKMRRSAFLINSARGALINMDDLDCALQQGIIAGAALDVLEVEPPVEEHSLLTRENCWITPHIAWATFEARQRLLNMAIENLRGFVSGNLINIVNQIS